MRAVIVKFADNKFSLKTQTICFWCTSKFFTSVKEIKDTFPTHTFHSKVLDAPAGGDWKEFHEKINVILAKKIK